MAVALVVATAGIIVLGVAPGVLLGAAERGAAGLLQLPIGLTGLTTP
jgi:hypothetical protein